MAEPAVSAHGGINMPRAKAPKDEMTRENASIVYFDLDRIMPAFFRCGP